MLQAVTVKSNQTTLGRAYTRIRDRIVINRALKDKLEGLPGAITLVAREIEHEAGIDLILPGRSIVIIADIYSAGGRTIDVSGPSTSGGHVGPNHP